MGCANSSAVAVLDEECCASQVSQAAEKISFHKEYVIEAKLGKGAFGSVYLGRNAATQTRKAVKVIDQRTTVGGQRTPSA